MHLFLEYTILGLVTGAVYGIAASGLVLTYTTSGIFNFAQGAMAMLAAFTYWQFRYGWNWPAPLALFVVIAVLAPLLGSVLYGGIMRGLRETAEVTKIVVTIGIMLGLIALAQWIWNPGVPRTDNLFFGNAAKFQVLGVYVTDHEAIALGCGVLIAVGIRLLFTSTRTGVAMRAVVDNPALLQLNGGSARTSRRVLLGAGWRAGRPGRHAHHPDQRRHPRRPRAHAARARLHRRRHVRAAAQHLEDVRRCARARAWRRPTCWVTSPTTWSWASNFRIALPMIVLFVVLLVLPQERLRGATLLRTRERFTVPTLRSAAHLGGRSCSLVVLALEQIMGTGDMGVLTVGITYAIIALSLTLLTGYAGEINLAPVSFGAIATIIVFHLGLSGTGPAQRITLLGHRARGGGHRGGRRADRAARAAPARPLPGAGHPRLRGLRLRHDHRRHPPARPAIFHVHFSIFPNGAPADPPAQVRTDRPQLAEDLPHRVDVRLRARRHRAGRLAPQQLRPAPDRDEGQPGGGGHPRPEPGQAEAVRVHALGGHRRPRRHPAVGRIRSA